MLAPLRTDAQETTRLIPFHRIHRQSHMAPHYDSSLCSLLVVYPLSKLRVGAKQPLPDTAWCGWTARRLQDSFRFIKYIGNLMWHFITTQHFVVSRTSIRLPPGSRTLSSCMSTITAPLAGARSSIPESEEGVGSSLPNHHDPSTPSPFSYESSSRVIN